MNDVSNEKPRQVPSKTNAFLKGGGGCLIAFIAIGIFVMLFNELFGSRVNWNVDLTGAVVLFLIGGVLGLYTRWIYKKGFEAGRKS
jgi:hypothetical protein